MGNLHQARNPCSSENMTPALCPLQSPSRSACDGACRMLSETGKELTIWNKTQEMHLFTALWKKGLNIFTAQPYLTEMFWVFFSEYQTYSILPKEKIISARHLQIIFTSTFSRVAQLNQSDYIRIYFEALNLKLSSPSYHYYLKLPRLLCKLLYI